MPQSKRKTLPKDFEALLAAGDDAATQAALEACEPDARGGPGDRTALAFKCSDALTRWLVARGASVDAVDKWGNTPLMSRITYGGELEVLIALGASLTHTAGSLGTPLHVAAAGQREAAVRTLIAAGAAVDAPNRAGKTPLELALERAHNATLPALVCVADALLEAGATRRPSMQAAVQRIGETFEFHRASFNAALLPEASAALDALYARFDVAPVPRRVMHDGTSRITVPAGTWQAQHAALWDALVPSRGSAATVQGEVVRLAGRIAGEIHRNGGANWDERFRAMGRALLAHVQSGTALLASDVAEMRAALRGQPNDAQAEELMRLAVRWVQWNPDPVPLPPPEKP